MWDTVEKNDLAAEFLTHFAPNRFIEDSKHESIGESLRGIADRLHYRQKPRRVAKQHIQETVNRACKQTQTHDSPKGLAAGQ